MLTVIILTWCALSIPVGLLLWACCIVSGRYDEANEGRVRG